MKISHTYSANDAIANIPLNDLNDGWWEYDVPSGKVFVSRSWLQMLGIDSDDRWEDLTFWTDRLHPDDREQILQMVQDQMGGDTSIVSSVYRLRHENGDYMWVFDKGQTTQRDSEGNPTRMAGFHYDFSSYLEVNRQIIESKKELEYRLDFETMLNEVTAGFINIGARSVDQVIEDALGRTGRLLEVDRAYIFLIDTEKQTMTNTHEWCGDGIEPEKANLTDIPLAVMPWWMEKLSGNQTINYEDINNIPDEGINERDTLLAQLIQSVIVVPMFRGKELVGFAGFDSVKAKRSWKVSDELMLRSLAASFVSVLIHRDTELELEQHRNYLQETVSKKDSELEKKSALLEEFDKQLKTLWNAVHNTANGVVITDTDRKIIYYNHAFCEFSGYNEHELTGKNPSFIASGLTARKVYDELNEALAGGRTWKGVFINRRRDGRNYHEENVITPIFDQAGHLINYIAIKQDVTKEQQIRNESQRNKQLRSLGTLAGGIAHDFNNILQIIQSYAELIQISMKSGNYDPTHLEEIINAASKGKKLTHDILTFSSIEQSPLEKADIAKITERTLTVIHPLYENRITLKADIRDCGEIPLNTMKFQQVIINLIDNAADSVTTNKEVSVTLRRRLVKWPGNEGPASVAELTVEDHGTGMSRDTIDRLFEPFFTTKALGEGTGLGLPIIKGVVDNHGGKIFIESEVGAGTRVVVQLPGR